MRRAIRVFVLTVCTARRPKMLAECLASILPQQVPDGWRFHLVVIDNDAQDRARETVASFAARSSFPIHYEHEPRPGISVARNKALEAAIALNANWIGSVDDDELLAADWLPSMIAAIKEERGDVIQGPVEYVWPDTFWSDDRKKSHKPDGLRLQGAGAGNVAFAAWLVTVGDGGLNLRFDEAFRFTGGEDMDFFRRAVQANARIAWSNGPKVQETVPAERATYRWQVMRSYRNGTHAISIGFKQQGISATVLRVLPKGVGRILSGAAQLALSVLLWPFSRAGFKKMALKGGKQLTWAIGAFAGMVTRSPEAYRKIEGS